MRGIKPDDRLHRLGPLLCGPRLVGGWSVCRAGILIPGGSGHWVDIAAISGTPGLSVVLVERTRRSCPGMARQPIFSACRRRRRRAAGHRRRGPAVHVTGLGRESLAPVIAAEGWWSGRCSPAADGSEFLIQATGLRVPLERGTGTLWLSHLPGQDGDQQALGEALALAAAEARRLTMIAEAGKLFGSSLDLDVVLDLVVDEDGASPGRLLSDTPARPVGRVPAAHGDAPQRCPPCAGVQRFRARAPAPVSGSFSGRALLSGEAILMARFDLAAPLTDDRG